MIKMTQNECDCDCCSFGNHITDYDELIAQLKETRDGIDRMIKSLEQRKVKDNVINQILNTEYDEEETNLKDYDERFKKYTINKYTVPFDLKYRVMYPYMFYPYFKF